MSNLVPAGLRAHLPAQVALTYRCSSCPGKVFLRLATDDAAAIKHVQCGQCFGTMRLQDVAETNQA